MTRKALIIGSPLTPRSGNYLSGVQLDIQNIFRLWTSSIGGAWEASEIIYRENPNSDDLLSLQKEFIGIDLAEIYYSGHGMRSKGIDYLRINNYEWFDFRKLVPLANRVIMLSDACRIDQEWVGIGGLNVPYEFSNENRQIARMLFDVYAEAAPIGGSVIFSSNRGRPSLDSEEGGVYTVSVMDSILDWYYSMEGYLLSVKNMFERSRMTLKLHNYVQRPEHCPITFGNIYRTPRNQSLMMPFAVNPEAYLSKIQQNFRIPFQYV